MVLSLRRRSLVKELTFPRKRQKSLLAAVKRPLPVAHLIVLPDQNGVTARLS